MTSKIMCLLIAFLALAVTPLATAQNPHAQCPEDLSKIAGWKGLAPKSSEAFSFVVMSDRTGGHVEGEWAAAISQVNLLQPDFVICVGDLIEGYTQDKAELSRQWEELEALTGKLDMPFFYCPGNHDVSNDVMLKTYVDRHGTNGKSYYSFDYRDCHFIVLDSNTAIRKNSFAEQQFAWLADDLRRSARAERVFVFFHHPYLENTELWPRLCALLPADKTIIFNGHWHKLNFELAQGIPTYVLAATAAGTHLDSTEFRMFAQVTVDRGKSTIALVPLHQILPSEYARFAGSARDVTVWSNTVVSAQGGSFSLRQANPMSVPVTLDLKWQAQGWTVEPATAQLKIEPSAVEQKDFWLTPTSADPAKPKVSATYKFTDPYRDLPIQVNRTIDLTIYTPMDISRRDGITVDGDLNDWAGIVVRPVDDPKLVYIGRQNWLGRLDSSFDMRLATDGERLFLAIDVSDDQICIDGEKPWQNDAVEVFWDSRPSQKRDGRHGQGTGQLILVVPEKNAKPDPIWHSVKPTPEGLITACKRRDGGYVYELSIPLAELPVKTPTVVGQNIWLAVMLDDRDLSDGKPFITYMTTTGLGNNHSSTHAYTPWTFK